MSKFILALLLLSSSVFADEWTTADTYRETAFQILNVIDWGQTRYVAQHPDKFKEAESALIIGEHPTTGRVNVYMAESAVLHFIVSYYLPASWRSTFQYISIGDKLNATIGNASIGVRMSF